MVQMVPLRIRQPAPALGQGLVIGMAHTVVGQREHRQQRQGCERKRPHHHRHDQHTPQHQRLHRMEGVGRPRRCHHRAVVGQVKVAKQPRVVQQAVVRIEVHVVPQQQHRHLRQHARAGRLQRDGRPTHLQQAPRHQQAHPENQHRSAGLPELTAHLVGAQRTRVQHPSQLERRQQPAGEPPAQAGEGQVERGEIQNAPQRHMGGGPGQGRGPGDQHASRTAEWVPGI